MLGGVEACAGVSHPLSSAFDDWRTHCTPWLLFLEFFLLIYSFRSSLSFRDGRCCLLEEGCAVSGRWLVCTPFKAKGLGFSESGTDADPGAGLKIEALESETTVY